MTLQDLFDTLAVGEFAGLNLANSVTGSIKEEAYPKVVNSINRSLRELYKRFLLKKKKVYLVQQTGVTRYYLQTRYLGYAGATTADAYLVDHPDEDFSNDVVRLLEIEDSDNLNVEINPPHPYLEQTYFKTSGFDTLDLVTEETGKTFLVTYQAKYPKIVITETFDPEEINLYFPDFIEEALCCYVASLLVKGKITKASEGEGYATNTWDYKYEKACQELIRLGLVDEALIKDNRFNRRGFV